MARKRRVERGDFGGALIVGKEWWLGDWSSINLLCSWVVSVKLADGAHF